MKTDWGMEEGVENRLGWNRESKTDGGGVEQGVGKKIRVD